jgi:predicted nucleotidyltransferase
MKQINDLPVKVQQSLLDFIEIAKLACQSNLVSVVLYGSAAEGRLRLSSDVNVILVLIAFDVAQINRLREKFRLYHAAIRLDVMFLLESEVSIATEAFAVKFNDILHRHRVLYGNDIFSNIKVSRTATLQRLKQVMVNLTLRIRERYALVSLREEQLVHVIAEVASPIRTCAATLLSLEGKLESHPKEALAMLTKELPGDWSKLLANISTARQEQELKSGDEASTVLKMLDLLSAMQQRLSVLA